MNELTNYEDYLTMGWLHNPRKFDYKKQFYRLKKIHNFSFNMRQKLTPQRKSAIKKAYIKYNAILNKVEKGDYKLIKATLAERKIFKNQYTVSNQFIVYNKPADKVKIIGKGKNKKIIAEQKIKDAADIIHGLKKFQFYIEFPDYVGLDPDMREQFINSVRVKFKPDFLSVAINHYAGMRMHHPLDFAKYSTDYSDDFFDLDEKNPFTGVYLIYYKKKANKQWLNKIIQEIELL